MEHLRLLNAAEQFNDWRFTNDLAIPEEIDLTKWKNLTLQIRQSDVEMGLFDADGDPLTTTVWGYGVGGTGGYLGPTLLAQEGSPVTIRWQNQLPLTGHILPVDFTLHHASPALKTIEKGYVPIVTHLHGGETDAAFDGYPEAWYTQTKGPKGPAETGPFYSGERYTYDNEQEAASLWYHDHALGLTRLNVYAGLAGFYRLTDDNERALIEQDVLPDTAIPLVIQDKAFTEDGQLFFPAYADDPLPDGEGGSGSVLEEVGESFFEENPGAASALPEFFGDHILVNGKAWPNLDVGLGGYTFELLNGSDSRFYVLDFVQTEDDDTTIADDDDLSATIVGTDGGLLPNAVAFDGPIVLAPGDRLEIVLDFSGAEAGDTFRLLNSGPDYSPFKGFNADGSLLDADPATPEDPVGNVMQFTVVDDIAADTTVTVEPGTGLNEDFVDITEAPFDKVRRVGLFEGADEYGRVQPLLGTAEAGAFHDYEDMETHADAMHGDHGGGDPSRGSALDINEFGPLAWADDTTEMPRVGETEKWEIFNFTADAHPIHLHLTQFQGIGRREIQFKDEADLEGVGEEDGIPDDTNGDGEISYGVYVAAEDEIDFDSHDIWISDTLIMLEPEEGGRHDTMYVPSGPRGEGVRKANIGSMLEIAAHFEKAGLYVWHCHILSHEDHEMMRPMEVIDPDALVL